MYSFVVREEAQADGRTGIVGRRHNHKFLGSAELKRYEHYRVTGVVGSEVMHEPGAWAAAKPTLRLEHNIVGKVHA